MNLYKLVFELYPAYEGSTLIIVVEAPCFDEVLRELCICRQVDTSGYQLYVPLRKLLKLQIHMANLKHEVGSKCVLQVILWLLCCHFKEVPVCQMGNIEVSKCSGRSCCGSGSE